MRPGFLNTCLASLYFLIASAASPRDKYREAAEHLPEVVKSVTQDLNKEPSCDELREMWRFSKRQSRAAESTNEIPTYRDPFAYNVWEDHASIRSVGGGKMRRPLVYGRLVHGYQRPRLQEAPVPERIRGFEDIARMFGTVHTPKAHNRRKPTGIRLVGGNGLGHMQMNNAQAGSFQHLKELIQSERARELHEQKMSEESAARESALHYQRMIQDSTGLVPYSHSRARPQLDPVVNFPDVLAPSNDYYTNNYNYMPRSSYPDSLIRPGGARRYLIPPRWTTQSLAVVDTRALSSHSPLPWQHSPTAGWNQYDLRIQDSETPSVIDQAISRLKADNNPPEKEMVKSSPVVKRDIYKSIPEEYPENELDNVDGDEEKVTSVVFSPIESLISELQESHELTAEENVGHNPFVFSDGYNLQTIPDLESTNPYFEYEGDVHDYELCNECASDFARVLGYFDEVDKSSSHEDRCTDNSSVQESQTTIDPKESNDWKIFSGEEQNLHDDEQREDTENDILLRQDVEYKRDQEHLSPGGDSSEEVEQEPGETNKRDNSKKATLMSKPHDTNNMLTWPLFRTITQYTDFLFRDKKLIPVLELHKMLSKPRLLNSITGKKGVNIEGKEAGRTNQRRNNGVEPSEPPVMN